MLEHLKDRILDVVRPESWGSYILPQVRFRQASTEPVIYLTFDDGPNSVHTIPILEQLAAHKAQATFFVTGINAKSFPSVVKEISKRGHSVGNHTMNHTRRLLYGSKLDWQEVTSCSDLIADLTGNQPQVFRPPYGWITNSFAASLLQVGLTAVIGDVYPKDKNLHDPEELVQRVTDNVQPGSIVILHDGDIFDPSYNCEVLRLALPQILGKLTARGFHFRSLTGLVD